MTPEQIMLVKKSWKVFREIDPVLIGDVFYSKLFIDVPHVKHLFKIPRAEQSRKLVEMLSTIIGRLDRMEDLSADIRQLALRHVDYGVKADDYKAVGKALMWTLRQGLGNDWTPEVEQAWMSCYKILSDTMIDAAGYSKQPVR